MPPETDHDLSPLDSAILASVHRIGRPLTIDELMPLTLPLCPHSVNPNTGVITYERDAYCKIISELMDRKLLVLLPDQMRGQLTYGLPES